MDVLPTRTEDTIGAMLPVAMRYFAEALCYNPDDVSVWLRVVEGAVKMNRGRLFRFALDSALGESLKDRPLDTMDEEAALMLPPATYKAVKGLAQFIPLLHDTFAYDAQLSTKVIQAIGAAPKTMPQLKAIPLEQGDCEQIRVEADSWYSLGKCLLNAPSKLYPQPPRLEAYRKGRGTSRWRNLENRTCSTRKGTTVFFKFHFCSIKYIPSGISYNISRTTPVIRRRRRNRPTPIRSQNQTQKKHLRSRHRHKTKVPKPPPTPRFLSATD
jgi:hypothetical protein